MRCRNHAPLVAVPYRLGAASRSVGVAGSDKQIVQFGVRLAAGCRLPALREQRGPDASLGVRPIIRAGQEPQIGRLYLVTIDAAAGA